MATLTPLAVESADISRAQLQQMFDQMAREARWDIKQPLLWGYFFTNPTRASLDKAAPSLVAKGYRLVDIHLGDRKSPTEPEEWWLHVERIELHTVDSLDARNHELEQFARTHGIAQYDGMDVGPVDSGR